MEFEWVRGLMTTLTLFLIGLVVAFLMGNAGLYLYDRKLSGSGANGKAPEGQTMLSQPIFGNLARDCSVNGISRNSQAAAPATAEEKLRIATVRLDRLEKLLLNNGNSILAYNLKDKLRDLDNFRANTVVEMKAIKEIISEIKPATKGKDDLSTKEMHKIIYRSRTA